MLGAERGWTQVIHTREVRPMRSRAARSRPLRETAWAFDLQKRNEYLRYLAAFSVIFTFVNSNGSC
ncbi:MAG: hypothetical protein U0263_22950 [Polyangiaceae bacterium]